MDSLPAEPQGKPKNTGVGSLSLLPADLPNPGIELGSPTLQAHSLPAEIPGKPQEKWQCISNAPLYLSHSEKPSQYSEKTLNLQVH